MTFLSDSEPVAQSPNRKLKHLEQELEKMLDHAEQEDRKEDEAFGPGKRGEEPPEGLQDREIRLSRLKAWGICTN